MKSHFEEASLPHADMAPLRFTLAFQEHKCHGWRSCHRKSNWDLPPHVTFQGRA